jgi:hypothetical protein
VEPPPLFGHSESNSSKNKMAGFWLVALSNSSLTFYSDAPIYLFNSSGPLTDIKLIPNLLAIALAI